jgi:hypothetical protein
MFCSNCCDPPLTLKAALLLADSTLSTQGDMHREALKALAAALRERDLDLLNAEEQISDLKRQLIKAGIALSDGDWVVGDMAYDD